LIHPDEAFEDFSDILFDSAEGFAQAADRCLGDDAYRSTVAGRMREVVVDRFSYEATMQDFLRGMGRYLRQVS
jgi:hypothetical protein